MLFAAGARGDALRGAWCSLDVHLTSKGTLAAGAEFAKIFMTLKMLPDPIVMRKERVGGECVVCDE